MAAWMESSLTISSTILPFCSVSPLACSKRSNNFSTSRWSCSNSLVASMRLLSQAALDRLLVLDVPRAFDRLDPLRVWREREPLPVRFVPPPVRDVAFERGFDPALLRED